MHRPFKSGETASTSWFEFRFQSSKVDGFWVFDAFGFQRCCFLEEVEGKVALLLVLSSLW